MNRNQRAQIAHATCTILETGEYLSPAGHTISIRDSLATASQHTTLYRPADYDQILASVDAKPVTATTIINVRNCKTLEAARTLGASYGRITCLNFASAKNPGGGFLSGSEAQEESLARASGLYATLQTQPEFYTYHRRRSSSLYSDHLIFSPDVPVFRDDSGQLLETPWFTSFVTAAAVNAGAARRNEPEQLPRIESIMEHRARMVLGVAALHDCEALVLGAWGCGVFRNDPAMIANIFARVLREPLFHQRFRHVAFAVYDASPEQTTIAAFRRTFAE